MAQIPHPQAQLWLDPARDSYFSDPVFVERNIFSLRVAKDDLLEEATALRKAAPQNGWWPVVVGGPEESEYVRQSYFLEGPEAAPLELVVEAAARINPLEWFTMREAQWRLNCDADPLLQRDFGQLLATADVWPAKSANQHFQPDESTEITEIQNWATGMEAVILLIPCGDPWRIPAWLNLGGWNSFAGAAEQMAIWRHWYEKWGSTIIAIGESAICGVTSAVPQDRENALKLAWQHFYYAPEAMSPDGAFHAVTIPELAHLRMKSPVWLFWWD